MRMLQNNNQITNNDQDAHTSETHILNEEIPGDMSFDLLEPKIKNEIRIIEAVSNKCQNLKIFYNETSKRIAINNTKNRFLYLDNDVYDEEVVTSDNYKIERQVLQFIPMHPSRRV
ncbi:hypothetical protein ABEB36_009350 [Hypothenemus hampei]|uniref:Uncharacterized protein n=1 Tax=Hypothenemus hampei TaxID=57062 RepID=A0ABD1EGJ3_HYPHA